MEALWEKAKQVLGLRKEEVYRLRTKSFRGFLKIDNWSTAQWMAEPLEYHGRLSQQVHPSRTAVISQRCKSGKSREALDIYEELRKRGGKPSSYTFVTALKSCCTLHDFERGKKIHSVVVESGFESDVYVGTMLIRMYCKFAKLVEARRIFDLMPCRNVVSWNIMILGYTDIGDCEEALQLYAEMQEQEVVPDSHTFVAALQACSNLASRGENDQVSVRKCLDRVRKIHSDALYYGLESAVFVGTMLVASYAKCGSLTDARDVFEKMPHRNVVSWTAMIVGYAQMKEGVEALHLYTRMQQEGVRPNDRTFVGALKACSSLVTSTETSCGWKCGKNQCLEHVRAIHMDVARSRFESDVFVGNMLIDVYAKCGSLTDARQSFENMPQRDAVSWNALIFGYAQMDKGIEALYLYGRMRQEKVVPNNRTFVGALKACLSGVTTEEMENGDVKRGKSLCLEQVRSIHADILIWESELDLFVGNMLVDAYAKCGSLVDARHVFENMPFRNVVTWNAMIMGCALTEAGEIALELYAQMQKEGVALNERTFVGVLKACCSLGAVTEGHALKGSWTEKQCLEQVQAIHSHIVRSGHQSSVFVATVLVDTYAKFGSIADARCVFDNMPYHDVVSWTSMIAGYVQMKDGEQALELFAQMQKDGVEPDERTFVVALKACSSVVELASSHEAIILGYAQEGNGELALKLYAQMQEDGVVPDVLAFVSALKACASIAGLDKGKQIHAEILRSELRTSDPFLASSLIDMYSKCGSMVDAQQVFEASSTRDLVTWNALIAGYAHQGESRCVFDLFEKMIEVEIQPTAITFLSILAVCSHVGLLDEGQKYFEIMSRDFGITPGVEHYTCMIDLFGRTGQVGRAMQLAKTMPFEPDGVVWQTLLGACKKWNDLEFGQQAFECAVRLNSNDAAAYVTMENIYASACMWESAKEIEDIRTKAQSQKQEGQSWWTSTQGDVQAFAVGDQEHAEIDRVHFQLQDMYWKMS